LEKSHSAATRREDRAALALALSLSVLFLSGVVGPRSLGFAMAAVTALALTLEWFDIEIKRRYMGQTVEIYAGDSDP
jgi:hypothetical protein